MEVTELIDAAKTVVPIPILFFTFALTYLIGRLWEERTGKTPWWLLAVPFVVGGGLGTGHYFLLNFDTLGTHPLWFHVPSAIFLGGLYAGFEEFLWVKFAKKLFPSTDSKPPEATQ